jgi:hypothetical protein
MARRREGEAKRRGGETEKELTGERKRRATDELKKSFDSKKLDSKLRARELTFVDKLDAKVFHMWKTFRRKFFIRADEETS